MRIGVDIMGGDFAPEATVLGAILAHQALPADVQLVLIGDKEQILKILARENVDAKQFEIVHTTEVIEMEDHPAKAFSAKQDSSIAVGFKMLYTKKLDGFASAGNTGAMLVATMYTIKAIPGVIRPCISTELPQYNNRSALLLDVGINPDCRPDVLYQYGVIGSVYANRVYGIEKPKVALLNIGSEDSKGNLVVKSSFDLMKDSKEFNFIGNIEGNQLFGNCPADVVVCDGFTGNVVLKQAEGVYHIMKDRGLSDEFFDRFNFENYGGTPVLGVNSTVIIGHGVSNDKAIKAMILKTKDVIEAQVSEKLIEIYK
ncbi:MAG TPA: phosphate acyltransferase PlsX [Marinilabiliales bacterium]|nr:phosphate acyltransferase PlsX [Marinilabiliales bacterium]HAZ01102.1 phosphate acyltransferase PlsX [Marinilabiliales bacterium]HBO75194.1 phosphate acyltransferase PlsX [Marinilabiliales bacterium]HBX85434.1 phosphate acyltransferase PlsX [Marinilabiliales bacterium]HBY54365.1 phosphate acyltransferase PlsX [Marinilabiliales bacterium]